jgi:tryptophan halogenase
MKIIIGGGGTAGWIAAYFIAKAQPNMHDISVIESSKIGIIGAGEGSTGSMIDLLNGHFFDFKVDINDFISKTDATFKMGIRHENWSPTMDSYFAPLDASPTGYTLDDYIFKYVLKNYDRKKIHLASEIGIKYENNDWQTPYALHFDGHKVGKYFKSLCTEDGVEFIDSVVNDINLDYEGNIQELVLEDRTLTGDFFIDCTGFSRILMNKLNVKWKSYDDILSLNTAMPFLMEYRPGEKIIPETKATALSAGWMWNIPLTTRRGCGYVFDNRYITKDDAKKEVESYLGREIKPIKWIEFTSGHSEIFWKKNVLCLGLSSSFVEPF